MNSPLARRLLLLTFGYVLAIASAHGQPPAPIVIGQTTSLSGGPSASVQEMTMIANLYFASVNAQGGIKGRPIELVTLDDEYKPANARDNAIKLIEQHRAIGLFLSRGTATTAAMLPVLDKYGVPLIAPSTGAMSLHKHPYVFNVRSSYQGEAQKLVEQIMGMGIARFGIISVDDAFGGDALKGVQSGLEKAGVKPVYSMKFDPKTKDFSAIVKDALKQETHAVIVIATNEPTIELIRGLRAGGNSGFVLTLSNNASQGFITKLGPAGKSVIVGQVFPGERNQAIPLVKEATQLLRGSPKHKDLEVSPAMLEGVAAAKVLVAALRRTSSATSKQLIEALESGTPFDVGWPGYPVIYSATDHSGLERADLAIVKVDGSRFLR
jgi:branched-chain amino acid transport system substrate-binding protein